MSIAVAVLSLVLPFSTADQACLLRFAPPDGTSASLAVRAEVKDIQVGGASMGVTGSVQATMKLTVVSHDEAAKTYRVQVEVSDVKAVFNGAPQSPPAVQPIVLVMDDRGRIQAVEGMQAFDAGDLMSSAGVPVQLLALSLVASWLPENPVAVGDEWQGEVGIPTPFGVPATARVTGKLLKVEGDAATLALDTDATIPPFQMANPMQPGAQMNVNDGKLVAKVAGQVLSLATGLVSQSQGTLEVSMTADMAGMELPLALSAYVAAGKDDATAEKLLAALREGGTAQPAGGTPAAEGE